MLKLVLHTTTAFIREPTLRRNGMFYLTLAAMLMAFAGATFLAGWLRDNLWLMVGWWFVCCWLTISAALLAVFDILLIRATARAERRKLERDYFEKRREP